MLRAKVMQNHANVARTCRAMNAQQGILILGIYIGVIFFS
jgi:hypothetical protein